MCGLVGFKTLETVYKDYAELRTWFKTALFLDQLRGEHSTGFGAIPKKSEYPPFVYKRAMSAADFLQLAPVTRTINNLDDFHTVLGHNRWATAGAVNDSNAHPFHVQNIVLTHNGTLDYHNPKLPHHEVDSARITMALAASESYIDVLESLSGAYALAWYDKKRGAFNLCRNSERPLFYAFSENEKTIVYASEPWMIEVAAIKAGLALRKTKKFKSIFELPIGSVMTIHDNQKSIMDYETQGFKPQPKYTAPVYRGGGYGSEWDRDDYPAPYGEQQRLAMPTPAVNARRPVSVMNPGENQVYGGAELATMLARFGLSASEVITVEQVFFEPYLTPLRNEKDPYGRVLAVANVYKDGKPIEVDVQLVGIQQSQVENATWMLCKVYGLRKEKIKDADNFVITATYEGRASKPRIKLPVAPPALLTPMAPIVDQKNVIVMYPGPNGKYLNESVMEKMIESGCDGGCNQPISLDDVLARKVCWSPNHTPICEECFKNLGTEGVDNIP